jgi:hypothetical protein
VTGLFIGADSESVQVEVENSRKLTISMDEVASIAFVIVPAVIERPKPAVNPEAEAARDALKALRTVTAATEVGITYNDYSRRLIDAKVLFDDAVAKLPEGSIKSELKSAWSDYTKALSVWSYMFTASRQESNRLNFMFPGDLMYNTIKTNYPNVKVTDFNGTAVLWRSDIFNAIWGSAKIHIQQVNSQLK